MGSTEVEPSFMRCVPGSINIPVYQLPHTPDLQIQDAEKVALDFVNALNAFVEKGDVDSIPSLFIEDGFWRDHLAVSWEFHTAWGRDRIASFLNKRKQTKGGFRLTKTSLDRSSPVALPQTAVMNAEQTAKCLQFFILLETTVGTGRGVVRLLPVDGTWKALSLYTTLSEMRDHNEATYSRRPLGVAHGANTGRKNWSEERQDEMEWKTGAEPAVVILGAGQAGLTIAARFKVLGVPAIIIDQNERVGDNWRKRYHQLVLHDPVWYDHMPYVPFPASWPIFTPKDKLADFFESYVKTMELNVWMKSSIVESKYHDDKGVWDVKVERQLDNQPPQTRVFHPRHVIMATGHSGKKYMPSIKGMEQFKGDRLCHSSEFSGAHKGQAGRNALVVGCCNSAHDIAQDFCEKGYNVTMVQRSSTCVVSSRAITDLYCVPLYQEHGPPTEDADLILQSIPLPVFKAIQASVTKAQNQVDQELLSGLKKSGFKLDNGPNDAGIFLKYFQRGGGYYIDVGASELIASGQIKVKHGQEVSEILERGVRFADGTEVDADEIVLATGYQNMRTQAREIFGDEVADRVGDVWGFDDDYEMRAIWRKSGHPGFWYHGGNLALCRYYSRLLALQIKALEEGLCRYDEM